MENPRFKIELTFYTAPKAVMYCDDNVTLKRITAAFSPENYGCVGMFVYTRNVEQIQINGFTEWTLIRNVRNTSDLPDMSGSKS